MINAIFSTAKLKWEILSYYVTTKEKRETEEIAWFGSYIVSEITAEEVTKLKKRDGEILKVKCNLSQLKLYVEEKTADTGGDTTESTVAVDNEKPSTLVNTVDSNEINYWDSLPNE